MTPEALHYLSAAAKALSDAHGNLSINISRQAARLSYDAQFHAAQALIFERTAKIAKTHKGVGRQFHKLCKIEPALPPTLAAELSKAYRYKEIADYDTGTAPPITQAQAQAAIATAEHFVAAIRQALSPPAAPSSP